MKNKEDIAKVLTTFYLPTYEEIPDIGLYLDQVVKYINSYFTAFPEMNITASMLTNYVKLKLVKRVNKKTYVRDQIASFIFIVMAKTVLSMDNIRLFFSLHQEETFEKQYNAFRTLMLEVLQSLDAHKTPKNYDADLLYNITTAIGHKMYLERSFETYKEGK